MNRRKIGAFFLVLFCLGFGGCAPAEESEYIRSGKRLQDQEKYKEAIDEFTKEIKERPDSARAYIYRGGCQIRKGDLDAALVDYDKAIALDPKMGDAYQARAALYFARFSYKRSWDDLVKAKELGAKIDLELLHGLQQESGKTDVDFFGFDKNSKK
jgi:tetratricopeptide (TPR) repeat protein